MILQGNLYSTVLGMDTGLTVVGRNKLKAGSTYKVVYLLHGLGVNHSGWSANTLLPAYANHYNILFVMPEVGRSFYSNMKYGLDYFTYITEELPLICKTVFNISSKREDTAVIGGSMGGYGALKCALTKPEQYGFCGALASGCLFLKELLEKQKRKENDTRFSFDRQLSKDLVAIFGDGLEWKPEHEILELAKTADTKAIKPKLYLSCGTEDFLYSANLKFAKEMKKLHFDLTFEPMPGAHDWYYFNNSLKTAIDAFAR